MALLDDLRARGSNFNDTRLAAEIAESNNEDPYLDVSEKDKGDEVYAADEPKVETTNEHKENMHGKNAPYARTEKIKLSVSPFEKHYIHEIADYFDYDNVSHMFRDVLSQAFEEIGYPEVAKQFSRSSQPKAYWAAKARKKNQQ